MLARVNERLALAQALQEAKFESVTDLVHSPPDEDPMNEAFELGSLLRRPN